MSTTKRQRTRTPAQKLARREYERARRAALSPAARAAELEAKRVDGARRRAALTGAELERERARGLEATRRHRAANWPDILAGLRERRANDAEFRARQYAIQRASYARHADKRRANQRARWASDPEYRAASGATSRAWQIANPNLKRERARVWAAANAERIAGYELAAARAKRAQLELEGFRPGAWNAGKLTRRMMHAWNTYAREHRAVFADRQSGACELCGDPIDLELSGRDPLSASVDHLVPLADGGLLFPGLDGLRLVHKSCNARRGNLTRWGRTADMMLEARGYGVGA